MGWLISIPMMIAGLAAKNDTLVTASAIFAIAGSIDSVAGQIKKNREKEEKEKEKEETK